MKALLLAVSLVLFTTPAGENVKLAWSAQRKLTWDDFKARPSGSGAYVASTNSGISFSYSIQGGPMGIDFRYTVRSNFYPERSWYRPELVNDYILAHEQTHFDISELFARKLRRELAELEPHPGIKLQVDTLYARIEDERRALQERFDRETDHSKIKEAEYRWRAYVADQIRRYDRWK